MADNLRLVTGASGLVGNNLVRQLLASGQRVRALVLEESKSLQGMKVEIVHGDVRDRAFLHSALESVQVVHHTAALVSFDGSVPWETLRQVNVDGTANVVQSCLRNGVRRLVHFSSIHALSPIPRDLPIDESRALADSPYDMAYDRSKAESEKTVLDGVREGLDAVILQPTWILGPNDFKPSASGDFFLQLTQRKLPCLVAGGYYCVDVRDVVRVAIAAEQMGQSGHRYILHGEYATFRRLAGLASKFSGVRSPRICLPHWAAASAAPVVEVACRLAGRRPLLTADSMRIIRNHQHIETEKAASELGFSHRPLELTVSDTIDWLRKFHH